MDARPTTRSHAPRHGFSVALPASWQVLVEEPELPALIARDPSDDAGQHPTFLVDVRPLPQPMSLEQYELEQQRGLPEQLPGYQCLEISRTSLGGAPALFRLCDYLFESISMTGLQWTALRGGDVVTVSATARTSSYPDVADQFAASAASLRWEGEQA